MNDKVLRWLEMLWICGRSIVLTEKHESTNHTCDLLLLTGPDSQSFIDMPMKVTCVGDKGTVVQQ